MVGFIPKILLGAFVALGTKRLDQTTTNGDCDLGTLEAPTYPLFLGDEAPWPEDATVANSHHSLGYREDDHYGSRYGVPNTGVTRKYKFVVSKRTIAPDGVEKEAIVVNGGYPGPTIVANWGDWIEGTPHIPGIYKNIAQC